MRIKDVNLLDNKTVTIDGCYVGNVITVERKKFLGNPCLMAIYVDMSDTNVQNFEEYMNFLRVFEKDSKEDVHIV